jgi:ribosome biogenesis GTPase
MRKARKQVKRNRKPKQVRRKRWIPDSLDGLDDLQAIPDERVMPRGERERREKALEAALAALEEETRAQEQALTVADDLAQLGTVIEVSSSLCRVDLGSRNLICSIRGALSAEETGFTNVVAVGDEVIVSEDGADQGIVEAVLPRRSILARPDVFHDGGYRTRDRHVQQIVAANADQLLIVASWREPHLWPELIDRYIISAERSNLTPVICINKIDLTEDVAVCRTALQPYLDLDYQVLFVSALTGQGVDELRDILRERMTILAGMSGVGKSSLIAAVQPGLQLRVAEVSDHSGEGRHTTAQVTLLKLAMGGSVIDTPGIREFGLSGLGPEELVGFYPEIAAVAAGCRFGDCSHTHEPGCAVKAAVKQRSVSATRYQNYRKLFQTLME